MIMIKLTSSKDSKIYSSNVFASCLLVFNCKFNMISISCHITRIIVSVMGSMKCVAAYRMLLTCEKNKNTKNILAYLLVNFMTTAAAMLQTL